MREVQVHATPPPKGLGGWLLILCAILVLWQPLQLGLATSRALPAVPTRGLPLGLLLIARVLVTAFGLAAGLALAAERPAAPSMARASLVLSTAVDIVVYTTPFVPTNRMPGDAVYYVMATVANAGVWLLYLKRSTRVKNTFA